MSTQENETIIVLGSGGSTPTSDLFSCTIVSPSIAFYRVNGLSLLKVSVVQELYALVSSWNPGSHSELGAPDGKTKTMVRLV